MFITRNRLEEHYKDLKEIHGVKFTPRQIDIIACIINGRVRWKQISDILDIEVTAVASHMSSIRDRMLQNPGIGNDIISFVERASNFNLIKDHYQHLSKLYEFQQLLKKIEKKTPFKQSTKVSLYYYGSKESNYLLGNHKKPGLIKHLTMLGIETELIDLSKIIVGNNQTTDKENSSISQKNLTKTRLIKILILSESVYEGLVHDANFRNIVNSVIDSTIPSALTLSYLEEIPERVHNVLKGSRIISLKEKYYSFFFTLLETLTIDGKCTEEIQKFNCTYNEKKNTFTTTKTREQGITQPLSWKNIFSITRKYFKHISFVFIVCVTNILLVKFNVFSSTNSFKQNQGSLTTINWNLPILTDHYVERKEIIHKIWSKFINNNRLTTVFLVGIHGLGGIGKTTLANIVSHNPQKEYSFIGWFSAETEDLLKNDYFELGYKYNLIKQNMTNKQKIDSVREWLENQKSVLLVYDNVPNIEILKKFLPGKGDVIVTSRNHNLPEAIEIDVMSEPESIELLDRLLPETLKQSPNYDKQLIDLAKKLGYFPLALSQAGAYISLNVTSITEYLSLYSAHEDKILSEKTMPSNDYHDPIYISWDMSIKELSRGQEGQAIISLLNFIAYCYPEKIPRKLLARYLYNRTDDISIINLNRKLSMLRNYSLVKLTPDSLSIHRLVHSHLRYGHTPKKKLALLLKGARTIKDIFNSNHHIDTDVDFLKLMVPQIEGFMAQLQKITSENNYIDLISIAGDIYFSLGDYNTSFQMHSNALTILKKHFVNNYTSMLHTLLQLGNIEFILRNNNNSLRFLTQALQINKEHLGTNSIEVAYILCSLGRTYCETGDYNQCLKYLENSLLIQENHPGKDDLYKALTFGYIGSAYRKLNDYDKSLEFLRTSLKFQEKLLGRDHLYTSEAIKDLGITQRRLGNYEESLRLLEKALKIQEKHLGKDNLEVGYTLHQLGIVYRKLGHYKKSLLLLEKAQELEEKHLGVGHLYTSYNLRQLASTFAQLKEYEKSIKLVNKAIAIQAQHLGKDHVYISYLLRRLGTTELLMGNYSNSIASLEKALYIQEKNFGRNHLYTAYILHPMGSLYYKRGKYQKSLALLEEALVIQEKYMGPDYIENADVLDSIALVHKSLKNYDEARKLQKKAELIRQNQKL